MNFYIGVDAGGTKTTAIAYDELKKIVYTSKKGPGNLSVNWEVAIDNICAAIDDVLTNISLDKIKGIAVGVAGINNEKQKDIENLLISKYPVPVIIESDYYLAYKSIFKENDGILIIVGTGVVLLGKYKGKKNKLGGWGHLLGDEGSGYDIVIRTFKRSIEIWEKEEKLPKLMKRIMLQVNIERIEDVKSFVYNNDKSKIASFTPIIMKEAVKGNELALSIVNETVEIIFKKIELMYKKLNPSSTIRYSLMGGVLKPDTIVAEKLLNKINHEISALQYTVPRDSNEAVNYLFKNV